MSVVTPERLSEIIGSIYDCVLTPDRWPSALQAIVDEYHFANSALSVHDLTGAEAKLHLTVGIDEEFAREAPKFDAEVQRIWGGPVRLAGYPLEEPIIQSEVTPRETWTSNAWYTQILKPRRLHDCATVFLLRDSMTLGAAAFGQLEEDGEFSEKSIEALRLIAPHLRRAVVIGRLFEQEAMTAATFSDVLEGVTAGIVLVDDAMGIVHANAAGQAMLRKGDPIRTRGGKLAVTNALANSVLVNAVAQAARKESDLERRSIDIPVCHFDGTPAVLQVLPLRHRTLRSGLEQRTAAAVFISNAADPPRLPSDAMALLYNLTPAEVRVFELIVEGKTPAAIAQQLGVTLSTVRTHLGRVFEKTSCTRQADLVAMAAKMTLTV